MLLTSAGTMCKHEDLVRCTLCSISDRADSRQIHAIFLFLVRLMQMDRLGFGADAEVDHLDKH
jgi:hypothetical protein